MNDQESDRPLDPLNLDLASARLLQQYKARLTVLAARTAATERLASEMLKRLQMDNRAILAELERLERDNRSLLA
jgi:hypothetical protein